MLPGRHWYLERVVLEEATAQGQRHVFPCYTWLDAGRPEIFLRKIDGVQFELHVPMKNEPNVFLYIL